MGKKGKGRQSGGFGSKNQRAVHALERQEQAYQAVRQYGQHQKSSATPIQALPAQRPRLLRLGQLKGILRERLSQESYELLERRRRAGFVPGRSKDESAKPIQRVEAHPPGWLLKHGKLDNTMAGVENENVQQPGTSGPTLVESLQSKCLSVFSRHISDYLDALGKEQLHVGLSLLPPDTIAALSVSISKGVGMSNELAYAIGKHAHVEELCLRSAVSIDMMLTDQGLLELVPRLPATTDEGGEMIEDILDNWEEGYKDDSDDDDAFQKRQSLVVDALQLDGVNVGIKRLELIDCLYVSADAVLALLEKCACITHLSLAGSIQVVEDGIEIIQALPELLPALQVLDVTRCGWMSAPILSELQHAYKQKYSFRKSPIVHCQGCFLSERMVQEEIDNGRQEW